MFTKKSTRKAALIVLAIILIVSVATVVIPQISANNDKNPAVEIVDGTEPTGTPVDPFETTDSTEPSADEEPQIVEPARTNEQTPSNNSKPVETETTEPTTEPTQPETTQPEETQPKPEVSETTEPETEEPEVTVPAQPEPPVHVHEYKVSKVVKATCTSSGYTTYVCACGHAYNGDATDPVEHEYDVQVIAPTVESTGYTLHTCKTCGKTKITDPTDKLPAPQVSTPVKPVEHKHAEIVQGGVTYVFCSDITVPYAEPGYVYYPWSYYPF